ncbi:hypothetical protein EDB85DRAFT_2157317 [Lactarius pseudohatsudake]|nr:hypothetical protein EDB85DRAFT_2157317 [Lactarius pseudohatsudake]
MTHPLTPTSGWDRSAMHWPWELCSRSFASVVKELDDDLTRTICGLIPIEDDISILDDAQQPLCSFHEKSVALNWNRCACFIVIGLPHLDSSSSGWPTLFVMSHTLSFLLLTLETIAEHLTTSPVSLG